MKNRFFALSLLLIGGTALAQNEPDSIHLVLHENQNGNLRTLDTIVPLSQQQALFTWMQQNGWDAPPPPPPVPGGPMTFEHQIVIEGDSGSIPDGDHRMMFITMAGDSETSAPGERRCMMIVNMDGDSGAIAPLPPIPPMPPMPPGRCKMVVVEDGTSAEGDGMMMRHPMPPGAPGDVTVEVIEKDTIINGETRKVIIRTERIVLPPNPPTPPTPPADRKPMPADGKRDLLVYPNPANSIISVEFDVAAKEKTTLRVVDMNGKVVYTEEIVDELGKHIYREINLTGKGKGAYTVEVKSATKVIAERVILQ